MNAEAFHDHFSGVARQYADFRPRYPAELFDHLAGLVPQASLVWDCACGNGQATHDLASRFARVIGTDASGEQIAGAVPAGNVEFRVAPAEHSGLPDASAGLITVAQALHWFDLDRFYAEARRVLKPGGVLAAWSYGVNWVDGEAVNALVQEFYVHTLGPYWPPERRLVEAGYRTISFPFEELTPPAIRMEAHWTLAQLLGYFSSWSATNRFVKVTGHNPLEPLREALAARWGDEKTARRVVWPLALRVGRK